MLIAEPWDIGPGGYQLGGFPAPWLEWNDRYRDRVRRFWRGDAHMLGDFATALAGSSDVYPPPATRSVNFIAAHDGFTLADLVAYRHKHNQANGEQNRDGHDDNLSWNNGVEGPTDDPAIRAERDRDRRALLATLFASRGTHHADRRRRVRPHPGRQQQRLRPGQPGDLARLGRPRPRARGVRRQPRRAPPRASGARRPHAPDRRAGPDGIPDVAWLTPAGQLKTAADWQDGHGLAFAMLLGRGGDGRLAVAVQPQRPRRRLPPAAARSGHAWAGLAGRPPHARAPRRRVRRRRPASRLRTRRGRARQPLSTFPGAPAARAAEAGPDRGKRWTAARSSTPLSPASSAPACPS